MSARSHVVRAMETLGAVIAFSAAIGRPPIRTKMVPIMTSAAARLRRVSVGFAGPRGDDGGPSRQDRHRSLRSRLHSFQRGPARPGGRLGSTEARRRRAASHLIEAGPGGRTLLWQGGRFLRGPSALGTSVPALLSSSFLLVWRGRRRRLARDTSACFAHYTAGRHQMRLPVRLGGLAQRTNFIVR